MSNSFGEIFRVNIFGESHGPAIGVVVDGCPAGLSLSSEEIQKELERRKPQSSAGGTLRKEADDVEVLSGIFNGYTTGTPLRPMKRIALSHVQGTRIIRLLPNMVDLTITGGADSFQGESLPV
jgi:hypothetical protein